MMGPVLLKRFLLFFWAAWFTIVLVSNLCDAGKAAGFVGDSWAFASGNFAFVSQATARYGTPAWVNAVLFAGVLVWEAAATIAFGWAALTYRGRGSRSVYTAFTMGD